MRRYNTILQDMQRSIMEQDVSAAADAYPAKPDFSPQEQIGVYITAYRLRLHNVIDKNFPASRYYLADKWDEMVADFIEQTPSTYYSLDPYPLLFPKWLAENCDDEFAVNLARLEGIIEEVYIMEDSAALDPGWLASQPAQALENTIFRSRTALKAEIFDFPAHDYLAAFRNAGKADKPDVAAQYLVVCRHNNKVKRHVVTKDEFTVFSSITSGKSLKHSLEELEARPDINSQLVADKLQVWFAHWLKEGWLRQA